MSSSASAVPLPVAPAALPTDISRDLPITECDAVTVGEVRDVTRRVTRSRHLEKCDRRSRSVVVRRVERVERVGLGQFGGVEGSGADLHPWNAVRAGVAARARVGLSRCQRRSRQGSSGKRRGRVRLGDARRRLWRAEGVESEDPLDLRAPPSRRPRVRSHCRTRSFPKDRRYFEIGVEKADWTWATVPDTGSDKPVVDGVPTVRPSCRRLDGDLRDRGRRRPELPRELSRREEVAVVRRLRIRHLFGLCRQRCGIARLERDGERQRRRGRCGPDEGGPGGNEALMAGELLAPGSGGDSARRGGGTECCRAGEHHGEPEHARDDRSAADQRHFDTPSSVRPHRCPQGREG